MTILTRQHFRARNPFRPVLSEWNRIQICHVLLRTSVFFLISAGILLIIGENCSAQSSRGKPVQDIVAPDERLIMPQAPDPISSSVAPPRANEPQDHSWEPPVPPPDGFDWIQLASGEWLKGELKSLYDGQLEFDSDELDLIKFDWEDVRYFRSARIFSVRLMEEIDNDKRRPIIVEGHITINEQHFLATDEQIKRKFSRDQIISIAPGGDKKSDYWSGKISMGLDLASGNTNQTDYHGKLNLKRTTSATLFNVDYIGSIEKTDGEETINNHRVIGFFDVFLTRRIFLRTIFGRYYRDPLKNIKYQATLGSAAGYRIIDNPKTAFSIGGGPAAEGTRFESVTAGEASHKLTPAFMGVAHFETEWSRVTDFDYLFEFFILNRESGTYTHYMTATIENEITSWLDFDISFVWDHVQDPTPGSDGSVPDKNDYHWMFTLGVDF